jgi:folate-dependent phosphoribosylglycinamide formyltransferase PurN
MLLTTECVQLTRQTESGTTVRYVRVKYRFRFQIREGKLIYTYKDFSVTANKETRDLKDWIQSAGHARYAEQINKYMEDMLTKLDTFLNTEEEEDDDF